MESLLHRDLLLTQDHLIIPTVQMAARRCGSNSTAVNQGNKKTPVLPKDTTPLIYRPRRAFHDMGHYRQEVPPHYPILMEDELHIIPLVGGHLLCHLNLSTPMAQVVIILDHLLKLWNHPTRARPRRQPPPVLPECRPLTWDHPFRHIIRTDHPLR